MIYCIQDSWSRSRFDAEMAHPNRFCDRSGDRPGGEPENMRYVLKADLELADNNLSLMCKVNYNFIT